MPPIVNVERGPFYCTSCRRDVDAKFIYPLHTVGKLINKSPLAVSNAIRKGHLEYRYELKRGKLRKVCDYFQIWKYISLYLPTPEELRSGDWNTTKKAMMRIITFKESREDKRVASRMRTMAERAALKREQEDASLRSGSS